MITDNQSVYDLIPNYGKPLPDGSYWCCVNSQNPVGRNGRIPLETSSVSYKGETVYIARWPARQNVEPLHRGMNDGRC